MLYLPELCKQNFLNHQNSIAGIAVELGSETNRMNEFGFSEKDKQLTKRELRFFAKPRRKFFNLILAQICIAKKVPI
jgi:hypothetical protein